MLFVHIFKLSIVGLFTLRNDSKMFGCKFNIWREKIVDDLKKERFELIERYDIRYGKGTNTTPSSVQKRVLSYVVDCENTILAVCQGRFPK